MSRHRLVRLLGPGRVAAAVVLLAVVTTAAVPGWSPIRIKAGDTLWGLARSHHTTVAAIERANHLRGTQIDAGALLLLPGSGGASTATAGASGAAATRYQVRPGDTLTAVAARFGSTTTALAAANHLPSNDQIDIGQYLVIPARDASAAGNRTATSSISEGAAEALVRATSQELGVPTDIALAVAYQESGFQQGVVSKTGAVGVMQVEPATARWLSSLDGHPLNPANIDQNVYAGVQLLHLLLDVTNERDAIAGYYQGLGSVQHGGMLRSTKQYVADVVALTARFR